MKGEVIADFDVTQSMLKYLINKALQTRSILAKPRVVICVPSGVTTVEERAVKEAAIQAGAREAYLVEEPMAAAIGAGLPVHEPTGNMVVDIGGGTTDVAIISLGGIVTSRSIRIGGDEMDDAIMQYIKRTYNLMIGDRTAEEIKINIGSAYLEDPNETYDVRGRDLVTGLPKNITVNAEAIQSALQDPITSILETIKVCLERTPPELAPILWIGHSFIGGGASLRGLDTLVAMETGMPVHVAEDPMSCVATGTGKVLENIDTLKS